MIYDFMLRRRKVNDMIELPNTNEVAGVNGVPPGKVKKGGLLGELMT